MKKSRSRRALADGCLSGRTVGTMLEDVNTGHRGFIYRRSLRRDDGAQSVGDLASASDGGLKVVGVVGHHVSGVG